jgi:catechol 2,3-dioxygenase-like lactoylglutathione lyase family enzyme
VNASRIDHVGLTTSNLERALRFYRDLLGFRVLAVTRERRPEFAQLLGLDQIDVLLADLDAGDGRIVELVQHMSPLGGVTSYMSKDAGGVHLAFRVSDLSHIADVLAAEGVTMISAHAMTLDEPGTPWDGVKVLFIRDPDGAIIELIERPMPHGNQSTEAASEAPSPSRTATLTALAAAGVPGRQHERHASARSQAHLRGGAA